MLVRALPGLGFYGTIAEVPFDLGFPTAEVHPEESPRLGGTREKRHSLCLGTGMGIKTYSSRAVLRWSFQLQDLHSFHLNNYKNTYIKNK